jgi:hypothetical protein
MNALLSRLGERWSRLSSGMSRKDAARWKSAQSMAGLGELVIAWMNGDITQTPGHCGPPCEETYPLIPALTVINRGGFVTDSSPNRPAAARGTRGSMASRRTPCWRSCAPRSPGLRWC